MDGPIIEQIITNRPYTGIADFMNKCNEEIILTDNTGVCWDLEREGYSKSYVSDFKSKYKYALEIYDYWRE